MLYCTCILFPVMVNACSVLLCTAAAVIWYCSLRFSVFKFISIHKPRGRRQGFHGWHRHVCTEGRGRAWNRARTGEGKIGRWYHPWYESWTQVSLVLHPDLASLSFSNLYSSMLHCVPAVCYTRTLCQNGWTVEQIVWVLCSPGSPIILVFSCDLDDSQVSSPAKLYRCELISI